MDGAQLATWVFDRLPPSNARRGGDPSEHAFRHDLDTFVREVVQNANDQSLGRPEIHFSLIELSGQPLRSFLEAISWHALRVHVEAAASTRGGRGLDQFLSDLERSERLLLLRIEDRNTVGLTGHEHEGESHFRALCKDTLYSHKRKDSAGGSFGLGKSVLWSFSGLSTVLFNSIPQELLPGQRAPRLIGRVELPSHAVGGAWYTGSGWYGQEVRLGGDVRRAESLWGTRAAFQARSVHLERSPSTGTSILIVGFREPASEEEMVPAQVSQRIRRGTARYFWPAMVMPARSLRVLVQHADLALPVDVDQFEDLRPFIECYRGQGAARPALEEPGDVVVRPIDIEIPARLDGGPATRGQVKLIVRLAPEQGGGELTGHVAIFRGAGMVVRYWSPGGLATLARPFHAVLACGEARDPERSTPADREVERFLRCAEPPGHDDWLSTPALKETYKRGYAKALEQLEARVKQQLREVLAPSTGQGARGPDRLRRRFPIGRSGGGNGSEPSAFHFSNLTAALQEGRWVFRGEVRPARKAPRWEATIRLREIGEDEAVIDEVPIEHISLESGDASHRLEDGIAVVQARGGTRGVAFSGRSALLAGGDDLRGELSLEVTGVLGGGAA